MNNVCSCLRQFVSKCSDCPSCRNGSCELLNLFRENVPLVSLPEDITYEDRALAIHMECDDLPCSQRSLADLIEAVKNEVFNDGVPDTPDDLSLYLEDLQMVFSWVGRMSRNRRLLLTSTVGAAIEHVIGFLDFSYLERGYDLEILFLSYFPWYKSRQVFKNCGYPEYLVNRYQERAQVINQEDLSMVPSGSLRGTAVAEDDVSAHRILSLRGLCDRIFDSDSPSRHATSFFPDMDLVCCALYDQFPKCGVREVDQLGKYHRYLPQAGRYLEDPLVESFRKKCREKAAGRAARVRDSWFVRVAKTLDAFNEYAQNSEDLFLKDFTMNLFSVLESELNNAVRIGYTWDLCSRNDIISITVDYYDEQWKLSEAQPAVIPGGSKDEATEDHNQSSDNILSVLEDHLQVLVINHYCSEDYRWINAKMGGKSNAQAYWVAHLLQLTFPQFLLSDIGELLGVAHIGSYSSRVDETSPFKIPIQKVFQDAGLRLVLPPKHH